MSRFLNSRDVADHLREIGYEPDMPEASLIVYLSLGATLDEKLAAWREIAETMPDRPMGRRGWLDGIPSTSAFLLDYVDLKRRELERFRERDGYVFSYRYEEQGLGWQDDGRLFGSAEACLDHMRGDWADGMDGSVLGSRMVRAKVDPSGRRREDWLCLNRDMEVTDVDCAVDDGPDLDCDLRFDGMWVAIPTPFRRGDIVCDARRPGGGPFVLDWLPTWGRAEFLANGFREGERIVERADRTLSRWTQGGDITDMACGGFAMDSDGDVYRDHMCWMYLDLEYAGKPSREDRWAEVVSAYLRREIGIDEAQGLLRFLRVDEEARRLREHYDGRYDERHCSDGVWRRIR